MTPLRLAAIVLMIIGAIALISPAITYTTRDEVLDVGPVEVTREETRTLPVVPLLGGAAIVIGIGLLITDRKTVA
jgi:hypothetical protein